MISSVITAALCASAVIAAPRPEGHVKPRASSTITSHGQLQTVISGIEQDFGEGAQIAGAFQDALNEIVPLNAPASIPEALSRVASAYAAHPTDFFAEAAALVLEGVSPSDVSQIISGDTILSNQNNINLANPSPPVYPSKSSDDAPYDVSEADLRSKLYIPPTFTYGNKTPVILVPGTGAEAGNTWAANLGKLLAATSYADPVYLNPPTDMLQDIQTSAEYVAYATNYISGISGHKNVSVVGWSQGSIAIRWAQKYWPSTRNITGSNINFSGDFHGTVLAYLLCPGFPQNPCPPSVIQQEYNSTFIATLRNNGGDSSYTPLTTVYSTFDEIVEPQDGTAASAYSSDAHKVGVTNIYLQQYCGSVLPGGTIYNTHEGVLYNALAVSAALDAIQHGGAADLSRIDVAAQCEKFAADGLSLDDILATESTILTAGYNVLAYPAKQLTEPAIKSYARKDIPAGYSG